MALTSPSDPAGSFLLLLFLYFFFPSVFFRRCFSAKQLAAARPTARPGPAGPRGAR